ncbi:autotransporter family protein [Entomomonas asaccharolytica]|uniref:Autotransporter outer membrane beta-barrel domain-containing protein n=1 Tax=Entomomonas asaccharolytica TaxID=2785331 RepID=A0A974NDG9_9GAMM|nr:autotransporter outer membrane beta-barrel domain-containing protein [Entomomonas asaccharolytica]QQP84488.1 autotransporter outer membrane beta-barrel domain-containing protein [Entomomonas asaccharolytica]
MQTKRSLLAMMVMFVSYCNYSYAISCSGGNSCTDTNSRMSSAIVSGDNTTLTFTSTSVTLDRYRTGSTTVNASDKGSIIFAGDLAIMPTAANGEISNTTAMSIASGGSVIINGDFYLEGSPVSASPAMINIAGGDLIVKGDANWTSLENSTSGGILYVTGDSKIVVEGKATIRNDSSSTGLMTLSAQGNSSVQFNELDISSDNHFIATAGGDATLISTGKTIVESTSIGGDGIWLNGNSVISLGDSQTVADELINNRAGISQLNIGANASINVKYGDAIYVLTGSSNSITTIKGDVTSSGMAYNVSSSNTKNHMLHITGGNVNGDVGFARGDDIFKIDAGTLTGDVSMDNGANYFEATGGKIIGNVDVGYATTTKALVADKFDASQLSSLSGAGDLTFSNINFNGYSISNTEGTGLNGWDTINLTNNTTFNLVGRYLQANTDINIDQSSVLQVGSSVYGQDIRLMASNGTVNNAGLIKLSNGVVGEKWTIQGNYHGDNGLISFDTTLGDDNSPTDHLSITGDTSGTTYVRVNNVGGIGAETLNGIELINIAGSSDGEFKQQGRIVAGAYDYTLRRGEGANASNWYLTSYLSPTDPSTSAVRPEAGAYLGILENQAAFNHSFHDRQQMLDNQYQSSWLRVNYNRGKSRAANQITNRTDQYLVQLGTDLYQKDNFHFGVMGGYVASDINAHSRLQAIDAKAKSKGYSAGIYGTWYDQTNDQGGLYVDSYALYNWFDNKVNGHGQPEEKFKTRGYTLSAETGYGFIIKHSAKTEWQLEPQAQLIYNNFRSKGLTERNGTHVRLGGDDNITSRLGIRLQGKRDGFQPFVTFNYWHNTQNAEISMNNVDLTSDRARNIFEIKTGGQIAINKSLTAYGQLSGQLGSHSTKAYGGSIGIKYNW